MSLAGLLANTAAAQLKRYGSTGTLTHPVVGSYNTTTGTSTVTTSTATVSVMLDAASVKTLGERFGDSLVKTGDFQGMVSSKGPTFTPTAGDTLTIGSTVYSVQGVQPSYVQGEAPVYMLLLRLL